MNPLLLKLTSFDEEEGVEFLKILDKDVLYELENLVIYYNDNISSTALALCDHFKDPNWVIMNKVLDMMFFLLVDEKFIIWYEKYVALFCGCYIHKKDGSEEYYHTFTLTDIWFSSTNVNKKFHTITLPAIINNIIDYKYIHIYTKVRGYLFFKHFSVVVTTKYSIHDLNIHSNKIWPTNKVENYVDIRRLTPIRTSDFLPDVLFNIKVYNNNKQYENPTIIQLSGFTELGGNEIFKNATGYIPLYPLLYTTLIIPEITNYRYLEYSYFYLDSPESSALIFSTPFFLNGKARSINGRMYEIKTEEDSEYSRIPTQKDLEDMKMLDNIFHNFTSIAPNIEYLRMLYEAYIF